MKSFIVLFAFLAVVVSVDIFVANDRFTADDSSATTNTAALTAGAALTQVSFTVTPSDNSIAILYPNSGTKTTIGSIANGATGFGNFQVLGMGGTYTCLVSVSYKKSSVQYYYNQTIPLVIFGGGDQGTAGKRVVNSEEKRDLRNDDMSVYPTDVFRVEDATPTWESILVVSDGPALSAVTFSVTPSDPSIAVYYADKGNVIGAIPANGQANGNFQINGNAGTYSVDVKVNYKKQGIAFSYTQTVPLVISGGDEGTAGRRRIEVAAKQQFLPAIASEKMNNATVAGLAIGGIALIAIVAVVVVVAVVRRQRTTIVA